MNYVGAQSDTRTRARSGTNNESVGVGLMLALTFVTGVVDAVGFLGLDRVFTGNMTGNIVILGMAVAGADDLPVLGPAIALVAFTFGACICGIVLRRAPKGWNWLTSLLFGFGGVLLLGTAVAMIVVGDAMTSIQQIVFAALTAMVMGEQAAVARALAVKDMTTVVVTSTLTSLASESFIKSGSGFWNRRAGAIGIIFIGAIVGALLLTLHIAVAMIVAAAVTISVATIGHLYRTESV